ncbi:hypothetical protein [Rhizobium leguminosarum]|uniref:hypothetical protein n=1 Tax=Rhizobium leguminosarum TaxID=384 RepID=UPI001559F568|nr:hypothetical protein [Rhizobium leguminosarum]
MIYHEDKPSGLAFPIIVILIAMVAIVAWSCHQAIQHRLGSGFLFDRLAPDPAAAQRRTSDPD